MNFYTQVKCFLYTENIEQALKKAQIIEHRAKLKKALHEHETLEGNMTLARQLLVSLPPTLFVNGRSCFLTLLSQLFYVFFTPLLKNTSSIT